jgi:pimeloyl-ACP methyl ester carboxylesterase
MPKTIDPTTEARKPQLVPAAGDQIAVTRVGVGNPIVCLHATGHGAGDFARLADKLQSDFEFVMIDWPGHAESPAGSQPASALRYSQIVEAVAARLELPSCVVVGNSIGGAAAIEFAARRPESVRGLVLCNPGGLQRVGLVGRFVCRRMARFFATGERGAASFSAKFRRYYEREVLPTEAARWRREEIVDAAPRAARALREAWESFAEPRADIRHLAPGVRCPVLLAWATGDRYVAWSRSRRAALSIPNAEVSFYAGGHAAFLEEPERFAAEFAAFVRALSK